MPLSNEDKAAIARVAKTVVIQWVLLRKTNCYLSPDFGPESPISLDLETRFKLGDGSDLHVHKEELIQGNNIDVTVGCDSIGRAQVGDDDEGEEKLKLSADFQVRYNITTNDFNLDDFIVFIKNNTLHSVVPYWREYSSSTCNRMGIAPVPVPFFLLGEVKAIKEIDEERH